MGIAGHLFHQASDKDQLGSHRMVGYSDDLGILLPAVAAVAAYIKDEHTDKANATLTQWLD